MPATGADSGGFRTEPGREGHFRTPGSLRHPQHNSRLLHLPLLRRLVRSLQTYHAQIVQLYKDTFSKEKRVEIILLSADVNSDEAKKYVEHYDVGFYTIPARNNPQADNLPGAYQVRSIPHCIAVDKEGNRLFAGHASLLFRNLDKLK